LEGGVELAKTMGQKEKKKAKKRRGGGGAPSPENRETQEKRKRGSGVSQQRWAGWRDDNPVEGGRVPEEEFHQSKVAPGGLVNSS